MGRPTSQPAKQLYLNKRDWVDVRIAPVDRSAQDRFAVQQSMLPRQAQNLSRRPIMLDSNSLPDSVAKRCIVHQTGVPFGDTKIRLGQRHLCVGDGCREEWPFLVHG